VTRAGEKASKGDRRADQIERLSVSRKRRICGKASAKAAELEPSHVASIGRFSSPDETPLKDALMSDFIRNTPKNALEAKYLVRLFMAHRTQSDKVVQDLLGDAGGRIILFQGKSSGVCRA